MGIWRSLSTCLLSSCLPPTARCPLRNFLSAIRYPILQHHSSALSELRTFWTSWPRSWNRKVLSLLLVSQTPWEKPFCTELPPRTISLQLNGQFNGMLISSIVETKGVEHRFFTLLRQDPSRSARCSSTKAPRLMPKITMTERLY